MSTKEESLACISASDAARAHSAAALVDELDADLATPWGDVVWERLFVADAVTAQQLRLLRRIAESLERLGNGI